jgi:hypothetical protein
MNKLTDKIWISSLYLQSLPPQYQITINSGLTYQWIHADSIWREVLSKLNIKELNEETLHIYNKFTIYQHHNWRGVDVGSFSMWEEDPYDRNQRDPEEW